MKKQVEITGINLSSLFGAVLMTLAIPLIIAALLGLMGDAGISLLALVLSPVIYGLLAMLFGASYNWLAPKFGGIVIEVKSKE